MVLSFSLMSINLDVACLHPPPCVQYSVYCYNTPSYQHVAVHKMANAFCVTSWSQRALALNPASSFLRVRAEMGIRRCTGTVLGLMCRQKLKWKAMRLFQTCRAQGCSGGALLGGIGVWAFSAQHHYLCSRPWHDLATSWSVSCTSLWNSYHSCQQPTCFFFFFLSSPQNAFQSGPLILHS